MLSKTPGVRVAQCRAVQAGGWCGWRRPCQVIVTARSSSLPAHRHCQVILTLMRLMAKAPGLTLPMSCLQMERMNWCGAQKMRMSASRTCGRDHAAERTQQN